MTWCAVISIATVHPGHLVNAERPKRSIVKYKEVKMYRKRSGMKSDVRSLMAIFVFFVREINRGCRVQRAIKRGNKAQATVAATTSSNQHLRSIFASQPIS